MKKICSTWMALVAVLLSSATAKAELGKPVAVVSVAGYTEQMANVDFFSALAGQPNFSMTIDALLSIVTKGQGLKGLDKSKPWGIMVMAEGDGPTAMAFIPVSSAKDLTDALAGYLGPASDEGNGILKISPRATRQDTYIREANGWAFISQQKYEGSLPEDPVKLLDGLNTQYDIAVRGFLQNISSSKKQEWMGMLQMLMGMAAQQNNQLSPELQQEAQALQLKMLEKSLNETDQVTVGWKVDKSAKNTHIDFSMTAVPGSQMAAGFKGLENSKTDLAGFLNPEYAVKFLTAHTHSQDYIEYNLASMSIWRKTALEAVENDSDLPSDEARQNVKTAINQLFDVADATIKTGKTDMGVAVNLAPEKLQVAVGGMLADGAKLEKAVKDLVELAKGEADFQDKVSVKFDFETYKGIRFHQAKVRLPDEDAQKVFGETLDVYLGVGDKAAYVAAGTDSLAFVKSIIDSSASQAGKQVLPMDLSISLVNILEFANSVKPGKKTASVVEQTQKLKGKDRILVTAKPIDNGVQGRLELEDGVLDALGIMFKPGNGDSN